MLDASTLKPSSVIREHLGSHKARRRKLEYPLKFNFNSVKFVKFWIIPRVTDFKLEFESFEQLSSLVY